MASERHRLRAETLLDEAVPCEGVVIILTLLCMHTEIKQAPGGGGDQLLTVGWEFTDTSRGTARTVHGQGR